MYKALFVLYGLIALAVCGAQENDPLAAAAALQEAAQGPTLVMVTGEIEDVMAIAIAGKIVSAEMQTGKAPIILVIDSYGGSLDSGATIISAMELCINHPVYTLNIGQSDSMGAYIFSYGQKRVMWPYSSLLFHNGHVQASGKPEDVMARLLHEAAIVKMFDEHAAALAHLSYNEYKERLDTREWWMTAKEALDYHMATAIGTLPFN